MVNLTEVAVLFQILLIIIIGVNIGTTIVLVGLAVDKTLHGQTVRETAFLGRPANGKRGDGHNETRQLEDVDNLLRLIDCGAKVAIAKAFLVHQVAECLGIEQGIDSGILERQEIVVARLRLALFAPTGGAVEVSTDGQHDGSLSHHGLVEVGRS